MKKLLIACLLCLSVSAFTQSEIGMDVGQPISPSTGAINLGVDTSVVGASCTPWVRINFMLGPWASPGDQTLHNGRTWQQAYNEIINAFVAKGIRVYGLIGAEAYTYPADTLEQYPGNATNADAWIQGYTYNFVEIVDMFKDRIHVFESYNEPNNWTNSSTAIVHAAWFAKILQEVYLNTKYFNGHDVDPAWQVTLVSGALFTFDLNTGGQYIDDTYWYGKNVWAWDWTHQNAGSYPLDGFGQHIYVAQGDSDPLVVGPAMTANIDDFYNHIYNYEDDASKQVWISEFGWESGVYGESFQAQNLTTGFDALQNDSRVHLSLWFTQSDFPGGDWGLYYMGNYTSADQKQSFSTFKARNSCAFTTGMGKSLSATFLLLNDNGTYFLENKSTENARIEMVLCNLQGQVLRRERLDLAGHKKTEIPAKDISAGIYLLKVGERVFKLLVY